MSKHDSSFKTKQIKYIIRSKELIFFLHRDKRGDFVLDNQCLLNGINNVMSLEDVLRLEIMNHLKTYKS